MAPAEGRLQGGNTKEGEMRMACLGLLVFLAGCTAHAVRCDARLVPINMPAPRAAAPDAGPVTGTVPQGAP